MAINKRNREELDIVYTEAITQEVANPITYPVSGVAEVSQGVLQSPQYVPNVNGWRLDSDGRGEFKDVSIGGRILSLSGGQSLADAITELNSVGGGTINLKAGTYTVTSPITMHSSINILGEDASNTLITFAGTSANISCTGTNVYTTGTITSITSGVNVTGSGTSWLANVTAGQHLFLGTRWYKIAAVTGNTTLILSEGYGDNVTMPGAAYRIATITRGFTIKDVLLTGSTGTALSLQDVRQCDIDNVILYSNNKGLVITNGSEMSVTQLLAVSNTSNGVEVTNGGLFDWGSINLVGNGGSGFVGNNIKDILIQPSVATANTADGYNLTTAVNLTMLADCSGNGSNGIELVATNDDVNIINPRIVGNTSDGIKLTATSDNVKITAGRIQANGGYGVNIAASTCDNTNIVGNVFSGNATAACTDSGTETIIRGNNGLDDNDNGSSGSVSKNFTALENLSAGDAVVSGAVNINAAGRYITYATNDFLYKASPIGLALTGDFTIELWIKFTSFNSTYATLVSKYGGGINQRAYMVRYGNSGGTLGFETRISSDGTAGNTTTVTNNYTLSTGTWYHLAFVYTASAGTIDIYKATEADGTHTLIATASGHKTSIYASTSNFGVGYNNGDAIKELDGSVDDLRVWSVARTPTQLDTYFKNQLTGSETGLNGYWKFNNSLADSTSNANTLSYQGGDVYNTSCPVLTTIGVVGGVYRADASTTALSDGFLGFVKKAYSTNDTARVLMQGEMTGLSGLAAGSKYYLSDTTGAISTTPGTNSRKVGIATSATTLLITNIW